MTIQRSSLLAILPLVLAIPAHAQRETLKINPDTSEVKFTLGAVDHGTRGSFHVERGAINFETTSPKMSGEVLVAAGSGNSGNNGRDKKMTNDVLDAPHFAEVSFVPTSYQGTLSPTGDSTIQVTGTFTLHGTPHELTVPMQVHIDGATCTAKTHFVVPYVKWGLKDPSVFILKVAKEVDIDLSLAGSLSPTDK